MKPSMKKDICSITLSVILVLFILLLLLTIFILNKNIEGYTKRSNSANSVEKKGIQHPVLNLSLSGNLNQASTTNTK